jgi:hypothetical protein
VGQLEKFVIKKVCHSEAGYYGARNLLLPGQSGFSSASPLDFTRGFGKQGRLSPGNEHPFGMTKMKGYSN